MAVDTRSRRASVLGIGLAFTLTLPLSDGTVGQPDRQHVAFSYPGIQAAAIATSNKAIALVGAYVRSVSLVGAYVRSQSFRGSF